MSEVIKRQDDEALFRESMDLLEAGSLDKAEAVADGISYDDEKNRALRFIALKRIETGDINGAKATLRKIKKSHWRDSALIKLINNLDAKEIIEYIEEIIPEISGRRAFLQSLIKSDDVSPRVKEAAKKAIAEIRHQVREAVSGKLKKRADR